MTHPTHPEAHDFPAKNHASAPKPGPEFSQEIRWAEKMPERSR
jgi:hypothetical protein